MNDENESFKVNYEEEEETVEVVLKFPVELFNYLKAIHEMTIATAPEGIEVPTFEEGLVIVFENMLMERYGNLELEADDSYT